MSRATRHETATTAVVIFVIVCCIVGFISIMKTGYRTFFHEEGSTKAQKTELGVPPTPKIYTGGTSWTIDGQTVTCSAQYPGYFTVRANDTLDSLVRQHTRVGGEGFKPGPKFETVLKATAKANGIPDPDRIYEGQKVAMFTDCGF